MSRGDFFNSRVATGFMVWIAAMLFILGVVYSFARAVESDNNASLEPIEILPQVQSLYEQLSLQTAVPILLPTQVPRLASEFWLYEYETVPDGDNNQYSVSIDVNSTCRGAGACSRGSLGGELLTEATPSLEEKYAYLNEMLGSERPHSTEPMGVLELRDREGFFVPWVATAQCSEARIYWTEQEYRYYVGIECGTQSELIDFANNVIANTQEVP